jgi:hypothetical protein
MYANHHTYMMMTLYYQKLIEYTLKHELSADFTITLLNEAWKKENQPHTSYAIVRP